MPHRTSNRVGGRARVSRCGWQTAKCRFAPRARRVSSVLRESSSSCDCQRLAHRCLPLRTCTCVVVYTAHRSSTTQLQRGLQQIFSLAETAKCTRPIDLDSMRQFLSFARHVSWQVYSLYAASDIASSSGRELNPPERPTPASSETGLRIVGEDRDKVVGDVVAV
jgi:hypothetical protein